MHFCFVYVTTNSNAQNKERQYILKKKRQYMKSWSLRRKISCYKNNGELIKVYDISSRLDKKKNDQPVIPCVGF